MYETMIRREQLEMTDPPVLLAILIAARRTGNRLLETVVRRELEQHHRIKIRFGRTPEVKPCPS